MNYNVFYEFYKLEHDSQVVMNLQEMDETLDEYFSGIKTKRVEDLRYKVNSLLIRNPQLSSGHSINDILVEAKEREIFKATLLKSVSRQNVSEVLQKKFIERNTNGLVRLHLLPKSGKNSYRFDETDGIIKKGIEKKKTKSIDGVLHYNDNRYFTIQKLTHDIVNEYTTGGAQNNQENDAVLNGLYVYNGKEPLVLICDGSYYNQHNVDGVSKIELLKNEFKDKNNIIITNSVDIKEDLNKFLEKKAE